MTLRALQIAVANAGTLGTPPVPVGTGFDPTDGVLNLCVYDVRSVADHVHLAWRLLTGRAGKDDRARFFPVRREVTIASRRPLPVQGDGEEIARTPVTLNVASGNPSGRDARPAGACCGRRRCHRLVAVPAAKQSNALTRIGAIDSALFLYIKCSALAPARLAHGPGFAAHGPRRGMGHPRPGRGGPWEYTRCENAARGDRGAVASDAHGELSDQGAVPASATLRHSRRHARDRRRPSTGRFPRGIPRRRSPEPCSSPLGSRGRGRGVTRTR